MSMTAMPHTKTILSLQQLRYHIMNQYYTIQQNHDPDLSLRGDKEQHREYIMHIRIYITQLHE